MFSVAASGTPPLVYQWSFNGTNILNATNTMLVLTNVQLNQAGNYAVLVTNLYGSTNSTSAMLTVYGIPPTITTQPTNQIIQVGGTTIFSVTASGTLPLTYQWSFNGTNLLNVTNAILTLTNVQISQTGNYSVLITNLFGSTNSATAVLTVNPPPSCDPPPSGIVGWWAAESNALDSVANNNGTLMNGIGFTTGKVGVAFNLNGINNYVLANPSAPTNFDVGRGSGMTFEGWINPTTTGTQMPIFEYERILGSRTGSDIGILFYINLPPSGGNGAGSINANLADTSSISHIFTSAGGLLTAGVWQHIALTYDKTSGVAAIYFNGAVVVQTNLGSFTLQTSFTNLLFGGRTYYGSASSPSDKFSGKLDEISLYNRALSSNEIAAIYQAGSNGKCPLAPMIFAQPANQSVGLNGTATFRVVAGGTPTLNYQWSFNGTNLIGATNTTLTLTGVQPTYAGNYSVLVANAAGLTNSANAVLTVNAAPVITAQPTNQVVSAGTNVSFSVTVNGTPPLIYQWSLNGTNISGATAAVLTLTNAQFTDGGNYFVLATNAFGSATSSNALLVVQSPPIIVTNPTNLTVKVGDTAVFTAGAIGSPALAYQWNFNGTNAIAGATNSGLTLANVQLANAGVYAVTVTNPFGSAVSSNATLTVVDTLDHFVWKPVPSPRFVNGPFVVTVQAMDSIGQLFTNFNGAVALGTTNGVAVNPPGSSGFVQGTWSGSVTISQAVSNLVLLANDGAGHAGLANPINVVATPSLSVARSGDSLLIFWPMDPAGFSLEYSTNLPQWSPVTAPPLQVGNQWLESIQLNYTTPMYLYRLRYTLP